MDKKWENFCFVYSLVSDNIGEILSQFIKTRYNDDKCSAIKIMIIGSLNANEGETN